jgi:hypothetical protein
MGSENDGSGLSNGVGTLRRLGADRPGVNHGEVHSTAMSPNAYTPTRQPRTFPRNPPARD